MVTFDPASGGQLVTSRSDFNSHVTGINFRHTSDQIDVSPPFSIDGVNYSTVATSLAGISAYIVSDELNGIGFVAIGDGYDTYHLSDSAPDSAYDSSIPALNSALNDLLNNSSNPQHHRIRDGGIVLIKAGTYKFTGSVNVPPGIIIIGEGFGTKIVNQISSPAPLFVIKADTLRTADSGVDSTTQFIFAKETILTNVTIADNFVEPKFLGDLGFKSPKNNDSLKALVSVEEGASLTCDNVRFLGKTTYSGSVVSDLTSFAINVDSTVPASSGTILKIRNCFIDGFACPVSFTGSGTINDHFIFNNNMIRSYGYLNSDFATDSNNTILKINACNTNVANNYCFAYDNTVTSLICINNTIASPALQDKCKINIVNNNILIKKGDIAENTTFKIAKYSAGLSYYISFVSANNNFNGILESDGGKTVRISLSIAGSYQIDSYYRDYVLFVDTSSIPSTIYLPIHTPGREVIVKDVGLSASVNNITLLRYGSTGNFEGIAADFVMNTNGESITAVSDGQNWWIV